MRAWLGLTALLAAGCVGATETNVVPAPCVDEADCAPDQRCVALEDVDAGGGEPPKFCQD